VERGEHLLAREEAEPLGAQLRRQIGTLADPPDLRLPRVYPEDEVEPTGRFNPLIDLAAAGLATAPGDSYVRLASERLRQAWTGQAGHLADSRTSGSPARR
jgi:hypothetical protein